MNLIHFMVSYIVLQRAVGHVATSAAYELSKYLLYTSYCGVCLTLTTGYSYLFRRPLQLEPLTRLDSIDFEVDYDKENDFVLIINKICGEKKD